MFLYNRLIYSLHSTCHVWIYSPLLDIAWADIKNGMVVSVSIRPVDLQVIIPRATEVSKTQQASDQQLISQQQQFAEQWQQISARRQQKVQSTSKTEGGKVHGDDKKKKNQKQGSQSGEGFDEQHSNDAKSSNNMLVQAADPMRGHLIDIKT
ncbi:hypothetical protein SDC9_115877 [bioreactor metagenome]|uniref:Uncharacterized protein n=1 Tax=bioreactor metagenome TaxID=1076179 RepID=A0A645BU36_9ZZZZ